MTRRRAAGLVAVALCVSACAAIARAAQKPDAPYQAVKVCSLVSLEEVRKIAPWPAHVNTAAKATEEPIGPRGSSCNYPTADVQVMAFSQQTLDGLRKTKVEPVSGLGDEAYVRNNRNNYAEVFVKVGPHLLTVQMSIDGSDTFESRKPATVALAKAFVAKLR